MARASICDEQGELDLDGRQDVTCTVCGCVCDDLTLAVRNERIVSFAPACSLAERWLIGQGSAADVSPQVDGRDATRDDAVDRAVDILQRARAPLIYGLSRSSTPGQRAAVRLADELGACIDTTASTCHAPSIMALQASGESTCTLGEIRHRSDLVIYWGSNPLRSHPRHLSRYVDAPGMFVPGGRKDRHLVVIDHCQTETTELADTFVQVQPGGDFELIWALRAIARGLPIPEAPIAGVGAEQIRELAERLMNCRYGAVFFGLGLTRKESPHATVEGLLRLVTDLNAHTRFVARRMRVPGDVAGADTVLCWQTGFPFSVSFARGYPRYNPGEYTADSLLARREVDAVLLVGAEGVSKLSTASQQVLTELPTIVLDYPGATPPFQPDVHFTTAIYGIHRRGTAYRMDEVPIELNALFPSPLPADHDVLDAIRASLRAQLRT